MDRLYIRVSTEKQILERQDYILQQKGYNLDECKVYEETMSGKSRNRPILAKLLREVEKGDNVVITDLSRLARSVKDLWEISDELIKKEVVLVSIKENIDLSTPSGRLVFSMLASIYQFEREILSERTKDALQAKKNNGVILGRPVTIEKSLIDNAIETYMNSNKSMLVVGKEYDISNATICLELKKRNLKREKK
jgi:DNA invertase Pin-like site-specific DNA recombinase